MLSSVSSRRVLGATLAAAGGIGWYLLRRQHRRAFRSAVTFETLDVFTDKRFGGNQLAVVFDEQQLLSDEDMQSIAAEFGFSETTFVLPPRDHGRNTAWVRIFSPTTEMPFAGHPNVGTATALALHGEAFGLRIGTTVRLEEKAGVVPLDILYDEHGAAAGAMLTAPEAFAVPVATLPLELVATSIGLRPSDLSVEHHPPCVATAGLPFVCVELGSLDALERSRGVAAGFTGELGTAPPKVLAYVRVGGSGSPNGAPLEVRARMHRKDGTEDAGTGSANCALVGLLASLQDTPGVVRARVTQGVEMGRPSELHAEATRIASGKGATAVGAVRIGGHCAMVTRGELVGW